MSKQVKQNNFDRYMQTYAGKHIGYPMSEVSVWLVKGEDANCDMGGSHYQPTLGYFEGKLEDVIRYAVELPNFWQWGGGGSFEKAVPPNVIKVTPNSVRERTEMLAKKAALEAEVAELQKKIGGLV